jgi:hypothetical protein
MAKHEKPWGSGCQTRPRLPLAFAPIILTLWPRSGYGGPGHADLLTGAQAAWPGRSSIMAIITDGHPPRQSSALTCQACWYSNGARMLGLASQPRPVITGRSTIFCADTSWSPTNAWAISTVPATPAKPTSAFCSPTGAVEPDHQRAGTGPGQHRSPVLGRLTKP